MIFTRNYGQAGAVELYGPELGLPQPYSGHMSYAEWGPPPESDAPVVVVGPPPSVFTGCRVVVTHLGVGLADVILGAAIVKRAEALGLGTILPR